MISIWTMNYSSVHSEGGYEGRPSTPNVDTTDTCSDSSNKSQVDDVTPTVPASPFHSSPTRGVKKVPSLRRGAAGYAQLLQSAVRASIEAHEDGGGSSGSFRVETSTGKSPETHSLDRSTFGEGDRRGQKNKRGSEDAAPTMPRRTHSRRDGVGHSSVLSHHGDDDSESNDMELC